MKMFTLLILTTQLVASNLLPNKNGLNQPPIPVEIDLGKGADCFSSGRICLIKPIEEVGQSIRSSSDAIGTFTLDETGRVSLSIDSVFTNTMETILEQGRFELEEPYVLELTVTKLLGEQALSLNAGVYSIETEQGRSKIFFD